MVFPVVTYGCKSWTVKMTECQNIDALKPWCRRRLLKVPWTARRSNQAILREVNPECSVEGLMMKLKFQCFGHLMYTVESLESPWCWKEWGQKEKKSSEDEIAGWHHGCNGHELGQTSGDGKGQGGLVCCSPWGHKELGMTGQLNKNKKDLSLSEKIREAID